MDFLILGVIVAVFFAVFLILKRMRPDNVAYKSAVALALTGALLLFWVNGAVGIIGAESDDINLLYFGVLAVGSIGAFIVRFEPHGMARVLVAIGLAQALIALVALILGKHQAEYSSVLEIVLLNGFFVVLFFGSAWLFRQAARVEAPADAIPEN